MNKLWKVVKEEYASTTRTTTTQQTTLSTSAQESSKSLTISTSIVIEDYEDLNEQALAAIHLTCETGPYQQIKQITVAYTAWAKLEERYGLDTYATLEKALYGIANIRASDYKDLNEYLFEFQKHNNKLAEMNNALLNNIQAAFFKKGLPEYMSPYIFTIYEQARSSGKEIDFDYLTTALIDNHKSEQETDNAKAYAGNFGKQKKATKDQPQKRPNPK